MSLGLAHSISEMLLKSDPIFSYRAKNMKNITDEMILIYSKPFIQFNL